MYGWCLHYEPGQDPSEQPAEKLPKDLVIILKVTASG